jgi:hypothetical protein
MFFTFFSNKIIVIYPVYNENSLKNRIVALKKITLFY